MMEFLYTKTPLNFFVQSMWRDEAFSYLLAAKNIPEILLLTARDFNPPLYYLVLHIWMNIFDSSDIALRSLSFLFFGLTIYIIYDILTQIHKLTPLKSGLYVLLFVFNPLLNYYAFEARMYSMLLFFSTLSMYAFLRKHKKLYIAATTLGLYTHYFMLFIILVQGIWLFTQGEEKKENIKKLTQLFASVLLFLPWALFTVTQRIADNSFWVPNPKFQDLFYMLGMLYTGYEKDFARYNHGKVGYTQLVTFISLLLLLVVGVGIYWALKKDKKSQPFIYLYGLWTFLPPGLIFLISFVYESYYLPRYLIFSTVGLLFLLIYCIERYPKYAKVIVLVILCFITLRYQKLNIRYRQKYSFYSMTREIKLLARPTDVIYVTDVKDFHTAQYYFGTDKVFLYGVNYEDIPRFVGKVLFPQEQITQSLPSFPARAFIITYNNGYKIASQL